MTEESEILHLRYVLGVLAQVIQQHNIPPDTRTLRELLEISIRTLERNNISQGLSLARLAMTMTDHTTK